MDIREIVSGGLIRSGQRIARPCSTASTVNEANARDIESARSDLVYSVLRDWRPVFAAMECYHVARYFRRG